MRIVGADTSFPVTKQLIASATSVIGQPPSFWGRYFTSPQTTGNVEYRHRLEDDVLSSAGIRVLPIARQTNDVGGKFEDGQREGLANARDIIETFGEDYLASQGGRFFIFLDVEGNGSSRLSADYYTGWADGLSGASKTVDILPCVYGIPGDSVTWTALARAVSGGATCSGLWLAHPLLTAPEPVAWTPSLVKPSPDPGVPVLLWQYMFARDGANLDRNLVNPEIDPQRQLLPFLIPPPPTAVA